ncbi:hypothetical protein [Streptomyces sp. NBC_01304]|uniref:hypothetical protein n=1 Tax=Streptomyces sp. NBC_01304 TaxID=2903818 RepID=UPI002E0E22AB|nr:hypothetical protein OG430_41920 [Streptomyces sp. NBC_01304]
MKALLIILASVAGLMALINFIQIFLGHQLIKPSASRRSPPQLRAESAAAALQTAFAALAFLQVLWGQIPWALLPSTGAYLALRRIRKHYVSRGWSPHG